MTSRARTRLARFAIGGLAGVSVVAGFAGAGEAAVVASVRCNTATSGAQGSATCVRGPFELPYSYRAVVRCSSGEVAFGNWASASTFTTLMPNSRATCRQGLARSVTVELRYTR